MIQGGCRLPDKVEVFIVVVLAMALLLGATETGRIIWQTLNGIINIRIPH